MDTTAGCAKPGVEVSRIVKIVPRQTRQREGINADDHHCIGWLNRPGFAEVVGEDEEVLEVDLPILIEITEDGMGRGRCEQGKQYGENHRTHSEPLSEMDKRYLAHPQNPYQTTLGIG